MSANTGRQALPKIIHKLHQHFPDARYALEWSTPLELLMATVLAAQTSDARVNVITKELFAKYRTAEDYANASQSDLEEMIQEVNYFRRKAEALREIGQILASDYQGKVPEDMDELLKLPRVARKTANVVLTTAFNQSSGIVVDSHVARVAHRLGLTTNTKAEKIEKDLMEIVPKDEWINFGPAMILHGRETCTVDEPHCHECTLKDHCERVGLEADLFNSDSPKKNSRSNTTMEISNIPNDWQKVLEAEFDKPYFSKLQEYVAKERAEHTVFPPEEEVFSALKHTPYADVNVLLLGQDPYHGVGQAHGLCFSVKPGIKAPPSLVNMYKELKDDLGCEIPNHGYLVPWAEQGMLMINAVLTVRAHNANSHKSQGWEKFTDAIIRAVNDKPDPVVFVLWGGYAQKKIKLIDEDRHTIIKSAHPSPLSVSKFYGSKPFSKVNEALQKNGKKPIDWQLENC